MHSAEGGRALRVRDGGRSRRIPPEVRGRRGAGVHGRDEPAAGQGDAGAAARPGRGRRRAYDYEYERNGTSNLFLLFAPLEGWRRVEVTARRTRADWARLVKGLVDEDYPDKRVVLVMDNLNTHTPASLYEAFEPAEARRIAKRLEIHYTPKHGSWPEHGGDRDRRHGPAVPGTGESRIATRCAARSTPGSCRGTASPCAWTGGSRPRTQESS